MHALVCYMSVLYSATPHWVSGIFSAPIWLEGFQRIFRLIGMLATGRDKSFLHSAERALARPASHVASMDGSIAELLQLLEEACRQARTYS